MAEVTLRRHLAALVEAGLIVRRDSPNGKRYARRGPAGEAAAVFGFDLAPLVVQAVAFEAEAEALRRQRRERQFIKERISLRRRDIQKWLTLALDEKTCRATGSRFAGTISPSRGHCAACAPRKTYGLDALVGELHADVAKLLELQINAQNQNGNDVHNDWHKQIQKHKTLKILNQPPREAGAMLRMILRPLETWLAQRRRWGWFLKPAVISTTGRSRVVSGTGVNCWRQPSGSGRCWGSRLMPGLRRGGFSEAAVRRSRLALSCNGVSIPQKRRAAQRDIAGEWLAGDPIGRGLSAEPDRAGGGR